MGRFLLMMLSLIISPAFAAGDTGSHDQKRVALVVGNATYEHIADQLINPANDAKAIAAGLRALNVEVIEATNLDYRNMREALRKFDRALQDADAGLFYYAGHGMEYQGQNYLFPTDAILETEGDVGLGLIDMDQVLQVMETSVPTRLVFLDACRNNPLARSFRSSLGASRSATVGRGLGRIDAAVGTFIAYATAPGEIAADGTGRNSPFTTAMLEHLDEPGLEISQMMHKVRNSVIEATRERQVPWESSSLRGPFILNPDVTADPAPVETPSPANDEPQQVETVFWESIKDSDQLASFEAYVERFGDDGVFVPLAEARIAILKQQQAEAIEAGIDFDRHQVQEALATLGYRTGAADGIFGPQTRRAIKAWQEENGVSTTAYLSRDQAFSILEKAKVQPISSVPSSAADTKKPELAGDDKNYFKVAELYQDGCENGNVKDCTYLGDHYRQGLGVEQDLVKSVAFYQKGCNGGDGRGCNSLGVRYEKGTGIAQDYARAVELYRKACEGGYAHGCNNLGVSHERGAGVEQDYAQAATFYRKACEDGHARGCSNLGYTYEKGFGVDQDHAKAFALYQKACDGDNAVGCSNLGYFYAEGVSVPKDVKKAAALFKKSCNGGFAKGCARWGDLRKN